MRKIDPRFLNVGMYLMAPLLMGLIIGYYLDRWFDTKPRFVLGLLLFGTIGSIYNLWKLTKELQHDTTIRKRKSTKNI